ncbi:hypothetical protein QFC24_000154 [Naganishia onofrii]|uniref:Uncharacterized protein n=1 Tax=Naganishia onofrii TaxID=1851511 RepID=A0ACC2XV12_9TREE|nr:hypothetical protein QFC24_000154 [Naganishia onofrii]
MTAIHLNFGRVSMDAKHNVVHNNLWKSTRKPNVVVEDELDIRFTFNIWQQPASTTETAHAKSTIHQVAKPTPFTWLPLLPLEAVQRLPPACPVVDTGISLSSQTSEDDVDTIPKPASRRSSVTGIVKVEHGEPARKKQRVSAPVTNAVELGVLAERKDEVLSSPEVGNERSQELAIRRVRMRDVDVVEDFLVGHSGIKGVVIDPVANTATLQDQYLPEFGTGVPLRIHLGSSGVAALAIQPYPSDNDSPGRKANTPLDFSSLDQSLPILALVIYRKTRSGSESVISHMQAIAVHPASRRLGLGQQLVSEALKDSMQEVEVKERTCLSKVMLRAEGYEGNGSREFWQRCIAGLKVSSRRFGCRRGWTGEAQLPCMV